MVRTGRTAESGRPRAQAESTGRNPGGYVCGVESCPCVGGHSDPQNQQLLEQVVDADCAPGMAHRLGGESPLQARRG